MHTSTMLGRALSQTEMNHSRYLDALHAFRPETCLRMDGSEGGAGGDGGGAGGDGGQGGGSGSGSGGQGGQGAGQGGQGGQGGGSDKGFPEGTPIAQMTDAQRAAYWQHQSQKHEGRNRDLLQITGGKHGDDLKAVFDEYGQLKTASQTDAEKALDEAKKQTRAEVAIENVRSAFELVLPDDMPEEKKTEALGFLNLSAFLTPDGKVDTAKVRSHAATLAPAKGQEQQRNRDWGGGNRETGGAPLGSGGAAEAERRFGKKSTTTS